MYLFFERGNRWHHRSEWMRWIALGYYRVLRETGIRVEVRPLLKCCKDCGVRFLTVANNIKRKDLRCPFGCRKAHKVAQARIRSTEYYRTREGKQKRAQLNKRRHRSKGGAADQTVNQDPRSNPTQGDTGPPIETNPILEVIDAKVMVLWLKILNPEKTISVEAVISKIQEVVKWFEATMKQLRFDFTEG